MLKKLAVFGLLISMLVVGSGGALAAGKESKSVNAPGEATINGIGQYVRWTIQTGVNGGYVQGFLYEDCGNGFKTIDEMSTGLGYIFDELTNNVYMSYGCKYTIDVRQHAGTGGKGFIRNWD
ncbi:hypothetical protein NRS6186_09365 [Bacillus subtilis]|uniref:hypothetical protein n=1 Tax=Bacillus TaxID=1386 RepID=UPI0004A43E59|nr:MULTISPECIES: hypothetical protein [Bacillus]AOL29692.1 hypothetical protein BGM20_03190 [Alkalicoccobacillus gibsonii]AOL27385.1 hypothetical protein BGM23_12660 [Bacillus sp. FJAT-14266]AYK63192.1 hypothetical protein D9C14_18385 [Bacillus subtilis subsp. subtilis]KKJ80623.1 hypothetical protein NG20_16560 [Bacillus subtilis]KOS71927.1 hypothetical protein AEA11_05640 [Bacillus subtilis]